VTFPPHLQLALGAGFVYAIAALLLKRALDYGVGPWRVTFVVNVLAGLFFCALYLLPAAEGEEILFDYASLGLTLRRHPMALLREKLTARKLVTAAQLNAMPNGRIVHYCGIVTLRQQPETANGTVFVSLEDETGVVQVICWKSLRDAQRTVLLGARLLAVHGTWQREGDVRNLIAGRLEDLTPLLGRLATGSRDFR
jgi:error-prone DNA polymerase